jgi:hypothetical protein
VCVARIVSGAQLDRMDPQPAQFTEDIVQGQLGKKRREHSKFH